MGYGEKDAKDSQKRTGGEMITWFLIGVGMIVIWFFMEYLTGHS